MKRFVLCLVLFGPFFARPAAAEDTGDLTATVSKRTAEIEALLQELTVVKQGPAGTASYPKWHDAYAAYVTLAEEMSREAHRRAATGADLERERTKLNALRAEVQGALQRDAAMKHLAAAYERARGLDERYAEAGERLATLAKAARELEETDGKVAELRSRHAALEKAVATIEAKVAGQREGEVRRRNEERLRRARQALELAADQIARFEAARKATIAGVGAVGAQPGFAASTKRMWEAWRGETVKLARARALAAHFALHGAHPVLLVTRGKVAVKSPKGEEVPLTAETKLLPGDRIETAAGGRADVVLPDGSTVRLGGSTAFELAQATEKEPLGLKRGTLWLWNEALQELGERARALLQRVGPRRRYVRPGRGATLAVRGSEFLVQVEEDGGLDVLVNKGSAVLRGDAGGEVVLAAGQGVHVDPLSKEVPTVRALAPGEFDRALGVALSP